MRADNNWILVFKDTDPFPLAFSGWAGLLYVWARLVLLLEGCPFPGKFVYKGLSGNTSPPSLPPVVVGSMVKR